MGVEHAPSSGASPVALVEERCGQELPADHVETSSGRLASHESVRGQVSTKEKAWTRILTSFRCNVGLTVLIQGRFARHRRSSPRPTMGTAASSKHCPGGPGLAKGHGFAQVVVSN